MFEFAYLYFLLNFILKIFINLYTFILNFLTLATQKVPTHDTRNLSSHINMHTHASSLLHNPVTLTF